MKLTTDLENVKKIAKCLLNIEIYETDYSPMIVSHPFTKSGIVLIPNNKNDADFMNIIENKTAFVKWKNLISKHIDSSCDIFQIYSMLNDAYSLEFFDAISEYLSSYDFSRLLVNVWVKSDYANLNRNVSKKKMLQYFKQADPNILMNEDELKTFLSLEDNVTIYRGVTSYNRHNIKALSWTLNFQTAKWFADRYEENGTVYSANIDKRHIYAYFDSNEEEVIVDPKYLTNIAQATTPLPKQDETPTI